MLWTTKFENSLSSCDHVHYYPFEVDKCKIIFKDKDFGSAVIELEICESNNDVWVSYSVQLNDKHLEAKEILEAYVRLHKFLSDHQLNLID
jgi:hypothetical protein